MMVSGVEDDNVEFGAFERLRGRQAPEAAADDDHARTARCGGRIGTDPIRGPISAALIGGEQPRGGQEDNDESGGKRKDDRKASGRGRNDGRKRKVVLEQPPAFPAAAPRRLVPVRDPPLPGGRGMPARLVVRTERRAAGSGNGPFRPFGRCRRRSATDPMAACFLSAWSSPPAAQRLNGFDVPKAISASREADGDRPAPGPLPERLQEQRRRRKGKRPSHAGPSIGFTRAIGPRRDDRGAGLEASVIVVFDIGNVLLRWDPRYLYRKVFEDEARMERFLATALARDFILRTDVDPDFSAAIEARALAFPEFADEVRMYDARWVETLGGPIEENVALLRRLRAAGRPVHALSNYSTAKFAVSEDLHAFLREFDTRVVSGHVGVAKPDPRIYKILIERAGREPHELVFVDDTLANVRAAEALGMGAIHYRPGVDLEAELRARGAEV